MTRALLLLAFIGCADEPHRRRRVPDEPPPAASEPVVWSDVAPLLAERCGGCHGPGGIGSLPLSTWREVHAARDAVLYQVEERRMPPFPAVVADYPLQWDPTLTEAELGLLSAWIDQDAPLGSSDPDEPLEPPPPETLPQVDAVMSSPAEYLPRSELADDVRCFVLAPDAPIEGYIHGYRFVIDNRSVIHHAKLVSVEARDGGASLAAAEAIDPEPGFTCVDEVDPSFGGPAELLATWLPGSRSLRVFPEGSGAPVHPGATYVLVVHYHPPGSDGLPDRSGVELWLEPEVDQVVDAAFFTNSDWTAPPEEDGLLIPAGAAEVEHRWSGGLQTLRVRTFDAGLAGADLLSASFHMHRLGTGGSLDLLVGGERRTLVDIPRWDVDWQLEYWPVAPIRLAPGDRLSIRCLHDNSDGDRDIPWGEATEDEMCGASLHLQEPAAP